VVTVSVVDRLRGIAGSDLEHRITDAIGTALLENEAVADLTRAAYWTVAPQYFRWRFGDVLDAYDAPPDPFGMEYVDPDRISRISVERHRANRRDLFGAVEDGDWDRDGGPTDPDAPDLQLYAGERFDETVIHRSLVAHFEDDVPWAETEFFERAVSLAESGTNRWHDCTSEKRVRERCAEIDALYESMRERGCLTQRELHPEADRRFLSLAGDEILVDVARDGELLFVDGRHRLSIAKILGLRRVPVLFLVRHAEWMARREELATADMVPDHPDLKDLRRAAAEY
jgi:hypothetical protein